MDVSGSMTDDQKEIVRIEAFWIDTWLKSQYDGVTTRYIIHDAVAREVDEHTFYHTRESGGTRISSAYNLANKIIDADHPPIDWNIYVLHFSDGDNWGEDNRQCIGLLRDQLLPKCNLFGYGQVESPYGSGEFYRELEEAFDEVPEPGPVRDPQQGRDLRVDQGVPGAGAVSRNAGYAVTGEAKCRSASRVEPISSHRDARRR